MQQATKLNQGRFSFVTNPTFLVICFATLLNNFIVAGIISMEILYVISFLDKSAFHLSGFMMLGAALSIIISPMIGKLMDKDARLRRIILLLACCFGIAGCLLLFYFKSFWLALSVEIFLFTLARNINPALTAFSYATRDLAGEGKAEHWVSLHRAFTSGGWIIGPPIGGFFVEAFGFQYFFLMIGSLYLVLFAIFALTKAVGNNKEDRAKNLKPENFDNRHFWLFFTAFIMLFFAMFIIDTNLPLLVSELGGYAQEVGILMAIAGVAEVIFISLGGMIVKKLSTQKIILISIATGVTFCLICYFAISISTLYYAQFIYGAYLGVMLGTSYLLIQKLRPNEPGLVSAYYYNGFKVCKMLGGSFAALLNGFYAAKTVALLPILPLIFAIIIYYISQKLKK